MKRDSKPERLLSVAGLTEERCVSVTELVSARRRLSRPETVASVGGAHRFGVVGDNRVHACPAIAVRRAVITGPGRWTVRTGSRSRTRPGAGGPVVLAGQAELIELGASDRHRLIVGHNTLRPT